MDKDVPEMAENENDETVEHLYVRCDKCRQEVRGVRYKCKICPDYDLCRTCKQAGQHSKHEFEAIVKPVSCDDVENFISAMKRFNVDGVTHILNNNTNLLRQFNYDHLQKLYSHFKHSYLYKTYMTQFSSVFDNFGMGRRTSSDDDDLVSAGKVINWLTNNQFPNLYVDRKVPLKNPMRDLFIWSVMVNKHELAQALWERFDGEFISSALTASLLLKSLAKEVKSSHAKDQTAKQILESAARYETVATDILEECFLISPNNAPYILVRSRETWGNKTLFSLAVSGKHLDFIRHDCCQFKLNKTWHGYHMKTYNPIWKIVLGVFFPFTILKTKTKSGQSFFWTNMETDLKDKTRIRRKEEYDIDEIETGEEMELDGKRQQTSGSRLNMCLGYLVNCYHFYDSPLITFYTHTASYLLFLLLFSVFLLTDLYPYKPSVCECLVWIWALTLWFDEFRQLCDVESPTIWQKICGYFHNSWNKYDQVSFALMTVSAVLRCTLHEDQFEWARMVYAVTFTMYFVRILLNFYVSPTFGPKVDMIYNMIQDFCFFLVIFSVFLFSYGIAAQSLHFPNSRPSSALLFSIVFNPYFTLFGQFDDLDNQKGSCTNNVTISNSESGIPRCSWLVVVLFSIYAVMTCILLVNLLIAMFNSTYQKVEDVTIKTWLVYRVNIIAEYVQKPALVPPLILACHIYRLVYYICYRRKAENKHDLKLVPKDYVLETTNEYGEKEVKQATGSNLSTLLDKLEKAGKARVCKSKKESKK